MRPALVTLVALAVAGTTALAPAPATAAPLRSDAGSPHADTFGYAASARAFGSQVRGADVVRSGPTAATYLCTNRARFQRGNDVADVSLPLALDLDGVRSRNRTSRVHGRPAVTSTNTVAGGSLLDGVIRFRGLRSVSRVVARPGGGFNRSTRTRILGLRLAGVPVPTQQLDDERTISVPGVARITLNGSQRFDTLSGGKGVGATVLRVKLLGRTTVVHLGRSSAAMNPAPLGVFAGGAYALDASVLDGTVGVGKIANTPLECGGTDGSVSENATAAVDVGDLLTVGAARGRTRTTGGRHRATAVSRALVASVKLADGALKIRGVRATARTTRLRTGRYRVSSAGTTVGRVVLNGERLDLPGNGRRVDLPGLGHIDLGKVRRGRHGLEVVAALVVVDLGGDAGLVRLPIGVARAYITR